MYVRVCIVHVCTCLGVDVVTNLLPAVKGLSVNGPHTSEPGKDVTFTLTLAAGSEVNVTMLTANEPLQWVYFAKANTPPSAAITRAFPVGTYTLTFVAQNVMSSQTLNVSLATQQAITGLTVTDHVFPNRTVHLVWSVTDGSHLQCKVAFGDVSVLIFFSEFATTGTVANTYSMSGDYQVTVRCFNVYSLVTSTLSVTVETAIAIGTYDVPSRLTANEPFDITVPVASGNPIWLFVKYGGDVGSYKYTYRTDWNITSAVDTITIPVLYQYPGVYDMSCIVSNAVTSFSRRFTLNVNLAISNLQVTFRATEYHKTVIARVTAVGGCISACVAEFNHHSTHITQRNIHADDKGRINEMITFDAQAYVGVFDLTLSMKNSISQAKVTSRLHVEAKIHKIENHLTFTSSGYNYIKVITRVNPSQSEHLKKLPYTCVYEFGTDTPIVTFITAGASSTNVGNNVYQHYKCLGRFQVNATCYNRISSANTTQEVIIERPIVGPKLKVLPDHLVNTPVNFTVHADRGGPHRFTVRIENGSLLTDQVNVMPEGVCNQHAFKDSSLVHTFHTAGVYRVNLTFFNIHGNKSTSQSVRILNPVFGISAKVDKTLIRLYDYVLFTMSIQTGTGVECSVAFGDTHVTEKYPDFAANITYNVSIPIAGKVAPEFYCTNGLSNETFVLETTIRVVSPIVGLHVHCPQVPVPVLENVTFELTVDEGNPVTYSFAFDDYTYDVQTFDTPEQAAHIDAVSMVHVYAKADPVLPYRVRITASNVFSKHDTMVNIDVNELVTGVSVVMNKRFVTVNEALAFVVSLRTGTSAVCHGDFGDGHSPAVANFRRESRRIPVEIEHAFTRPGNYTPRFHVRNTLSSNNYTWPHQIFVQYPINGIELTSPSPVALPLARYTVELVDTEHAPSNPFCKWTFANGTTTTVFATRLGRGLPYSVSVSYDETQTGDQTVTVNCSNLVSWRTKQVTVSVQRAVEGVGITMFTTAIAVGKKANFDVTAEKGSHLKYAVRFDTATDTMEHFVHPNILNSTAPFNIEHRYPIVGVYRVVVTVYNDVSSVDVPATQLIIVQAPIKGVNVTTNSPVRTPPGEVTYTVTAESGAVDVVLVWNFGDGSATRTHRVRTITQQTPLIKEHRVAGHTYREFTTTLNCSNLISYALLEVPVVVEVLIAGVALNASSRYVTPGDVVSLSARAAQGSNVTFTVRYLDGTPDDVKGPYPSDTYVDFSHTYRRPRNYTVQLTAVNDVSRLPTRLRGKVVVQHPVRSYGVRLTFPKVVSTLAMSAVFSLSVVQGTPVPTDAFITVDDSLSPTWSKFIGRRWPYEWTQRYDGFDPGHVTLNVTVSNLVSSHQIVADVVLVEPVSEVNVTVPTAVVTGRLVTVHVRMTTGSDMDARVEFGDGAVEDVTMAGTLHQYNVTHTYNVTGQYQVAMTGESHS